MTQLYICLLVSCYVIISMFKMSQTDCKKVGFLINKEINGHLIIYNVKMLKKKSWKPKKALQINALEIFVIQVWTF